MNATENLTSDEKAAYLETDQQLTTVHTESAQEGQTEVNSFFLNLKGDSNFYLILKSFRHQILMMMLIYIL